MEGFERRKIGETCDEGFKFLSVCELRAGQGELLEFFLTFPVCISNLLASDVFEVKVAES